MYASAAIAPYEVKPRRTRSYSFAQPPHVARPRPFFDVLQMRTTDQLFSDSAQELESAYSASHLSSYQDINFMNSNPDPNSLLLNTDPSIPVAAADSGFEPTPRSLSASIAPPDLGDAGAGPSSRLAGMPGRPDSGMGLSPRKPPQRGQGYRRLWQQVTKVSKGQKLQDNVGLAFSDMTVEDLLKIVMKLAPQVRPKRPRTTAPAYTWAAFASEDSVCAAPCRELNLR
jgi:hypothetical protein